MFYSSILWQHFHSGCYVWKSLIIWTFQNLTFLILSQNSFRNELHAPFLTYFDTQHLIYKKLIMFIGGVSGGPKTVIKKGMISKNFSIRICKKIFLIRAKKNLYWVSQNLGPKPSFLNIFSKILQKWTQRTLFALFCYPWPHRPKCSFWS